MKSIVLAAALALLAQSAHADYPSPTFKNLTVQNPPTINGCTGPLVGNGTLPATCVVTQTTFTSQAALCDETAKSGDPCPLLPGHHHQESTTENTVTGKVVTQITWYDLDGAEILCAELTTKST